MSNVYTLKDFAEADARRARKQSIFTSYSDFYYANQNLCDVAMVATVALIVGACLFGLAHV